jgi:biotin transport system substrate-specific component
VTTLALELAPARSRAAARVAYHVGCAVVGALLLSVLAQVSIPLPFTPVPITGQTLGVLLVGAAAYTGGYLWGFVVASGLVGWLSRRGWDRTFGSAIGAMVLGEVVLYAIGLPWLSRAFAIAGLPSSVEATLAAGLYPYVVGDVLKLLAAAALLPGAWWILQRMRPRED